LIAYELAIYVGLLLGSFGSGYAYEDTDSYIVFSISAVSIFAALFLMTILLPESLPMRNRVQLTSSTDTSVFSLLKNLWRTCTKPREHKNRFILLTIMVVLLLTAFVAGKSQKY